MGFQNMSWKSSEIKHTTKLKQVYGLRYLSIPRYTHSLLQSAALHIISLVFCPVSIYSEPEITGIYCSTWLRWNTTLLALSTANVCTRYLIDRQQWCSDTMVHERTNVTLTYAQCSDTRVHERTNVTLTYAQCSDTRVHLNPTQTNQFN